ncbi:MAG: hypothetical protein PGN24_03710 [Microbacterium arborescens]
MAVQRNARSVRPEAPEAANLARDAVTQTIREHLRTGEPLPEGLVDQLVNAEAAQRAHETIIGIIADEVRHASLTAEFIVTNPDPAAFEVLDLELAALVDEARALIADLDGATSADAAVTAGADAVAAWGKLQGLADRYDGIRSVQKDLIPASQLQFWDRLTTTGSYRDAATVHPRFTGTGPALSAEYGWWPEDIDRTAGLVRIVTTTEPHVPSLEAMNTEYDAAAAKARRRDRD